MTLTITHLQVAVDRWAPDRQDAGLALLWAGASAGAVRLCLAGELDLATAPVLTTGLSPLLEPGQGPDEAYDVVRLDLADLRLLDLSGLDALLDAATRLTRCGWRVCIARPAPQALRLLQHAVGGGWLPTHLARAQTGQWQLLGGAPGPG